MLTKHKTLPAEVPALLSQAEAAPDRWAPEVCLKLLEAYNRCLQWKLDNCCGIDAAHNIALAITGLLGDGLRLCRVRCGFPNTAAPGFWGPGAL